VTAVTQSVGPALTKVSGDWQYVGFVNGIRTRSSSAAGTESDDLLVPGVDLATIPKGYLGEPLFERPLSVEVRGSDHVFGSDSDFAQIHITGERVLRITDGWHVLVRNEIGATFVSRFDNLPAVMRFFAGGANSVRGFPYDTLSPVTRICSHTPTGTPILTSPACPEVIQAVRVGGKDVLTGSVELVRDLPHNFGIAMFFDYGNAFNSFRDPQLQYAAGIGLRVRLPVVTLGIDVGQPLSMSGRPQLEFNFSPKL